MEELDFVISCERKPIGAVGRGHAIAMRLVGMCRACACEHKCPWREAFGGERQGGEVAGSAPRGCGGGAGGVHLRDRATAATAARLLSFCTMLRPPPSLPCHVQGWSLRCGSPKRLVVKFTQRGQIFQPGQRSWRFHRLK